MFFPGYMKKDGKFWYIEVPQLDVATQGKNQKEAFAMITDAIESLVNKKGFKVLVEPLGKNTFCVSANNPKVLMSLLLKRQRESRGMTVREVATLMKYRSHSAYAQYESGKNLPGIDVVLRFFEAIDPSAIPIMAIKNKGQPEIRL